MARRAPLLALVLLAACGEALPRAPRAEQPPARQRPEGVVANCAGRSMFDFPGADRNPDALVAGPLTLLNAAYTPIETIREFGGDKIPALVRPGHRVTIALSAEDRRHVGLGFGPLPQGEVGLADAHRAVTFVPCPPDEASGSTLGGEPVTFWMGFLLADAEPRCVPLEVWVDDEPVPRTVTLALGRRC